VPDPIAERIVKFLVSIGLPVRAGQVPGPSFVPGITIEAGALVVDEGRLLYPGDLLHEAGHLALLPRDRRAAIHGDAGDNAGLEVGAIAWSYAAALHLEIDPAIVFHEAGYRGASQSLLENFAAGYYIGVPILQWVGLTTAQAYPTMHTWLRDEVNPTA
jgi:hypothetical protein